ncbi:nucleotidyltransferase domain-containing protein [Rhodoferax antarcticus]|uniref:nucleotidyltransferase domain-containing protein n=1 Tax=Rhodoferax antarcticus TaxID=81479 RepID=UPI002225364D|nr:nucleotidyltransferase domain-containing protein [Rhodoferax antarcticus]MCW2311749.1 putative nucleotidyltransferase [Rhodoferax antarcticus]
MFEVGGTQTLSQFGLPAKAVSDLLGVLSQDAAIQQAIVYGSRAKGNYRPGSDIDLALDAPGLDFEKLLRLETALDDLMLPYRIDLSLLHHIDNPDLLDHIARVGRVLYKNTNSI